METAPELRALLLDYYQGSSHGDVALLDGLIDRDAGTLVIGTDLQEWWEGGEEIVATWSAAWRARGGLPVSEANPRAYREGSVGWVADRALFLLPNGKQIPFRLTAVFHQRDAGWTMVQAHFSFGVPNASVAIETTEEP